MPLHGIVIDDVPMPLWVPKHWAGSPLLHACKPVLLLWDALFGHLKVLVRAKESHYDLAERSVVKRW